MNILAIDTALPAVSVCVLDDASAQPLSMETLPMTRGHAENLMPVIEKVLKESIRGSTSIGKVAVTVGPGSFTGIRVGISAAKGLALAWGIPIVGVSTLAAFAAPHIATQGNEVIASAVDARHGHVYVQAFAPGGRILIAPRAMLIRDAIRALGSGPVKMVGSAAPMMAIEAWSMGLRADVASDLNSPDIAYVARLGMLADPERSPARPMYLRPVDAKPQKTGSVAPNLTG